MTRTPNQNTCELLASTSNDHRSIAYYRSVSRRHDGTRLLDKAKQIVADGAQKAPRFRAVAEAETKAQTVGWQRAFPCKFSAVPWRLRLPQRMTAAAAHCLTQALLAWFGTESTSIANIQTMAAGRCASIMVSGWGLAVFESKGWRLRGSLWRIHHDGIETR